MDNIYAKLECTNPCGSIKDRIAKYIIDESEKKGLLKKGMTIVEATSGNTGISVSYYGVSKGYKVIIVMPENMTQERQQIIKQIGAELVLCKAGDFVEAARIRDEMAKQPGFFNPDQFSNPLNVECHYKTTGQEIINQMKEHANSIDAFVAGIGTGGTLIGVAQALKEINPKVYIAAVEPTESAVMSGKPAGIHGIQGIGDGFIPEIATDGKGGLHKYINDVICITTQDATEAAKYLCDKHGYCVGISSGANYLAAKQLNKKFNTVVTVFSDGYLKYQSNGLTPCKKGHCSYPEECENIIFKYCQNKHNKKA
ncbi:MAG: cysteine synthase family protein [Proteobacteria bacterium]|nr:cysteine synthase family protein [Pseudomonadota bacterium]